MWTEHFRLWLAAELLQPLDRLVRRAQKVGIFSLSPACYSASCRSMQCSCYAGLTPESAPAAP